MLKSHIAGQPHRIRQSSPRASISLRTAAQRRSRSASEGVGYSTSLRMALCPRRASAEVEPMTLVRTPPWPPARRAGQERSVDGQLQAIQRDKQDPLVPAKAGTQGRGSGLGVPGLASLARDTKSWIPALAGMSGNGRLIWTEFALVSGPRVLAQDVPELRLERGERFHQRGGIELPGDAGRQLVCGVIGKMSPVRLPIQHRAAPRS